MKINENASADGRLNLPFQNFEYYTFGVTIPTLTI